jgi:hypothetical protein
MNERVCAPLRATLGDLRARLTAVQEALADLVLGPTEGPALPGSGRPPKDKQKVATLWIQYSVARKQFLAAGGR